MGATTTAGDRMVVCLLHRVFIRHIAHNVTGRNDYFEEFCSKAKFIASRRLAKHCSVKH